MVRLAIRCRPDQADAVLAELTVLAPNGVEELHGDGFVEYAIYGADGEVPDVGELDAAIGGALVDVQSSVVPEDWETRWQQFHQPVSIGDRIYLRPPWADPPDRALEDVVIDPGQAFGTGAHPTTRLCIELLLRGRGVPEAGPLIDLGSGSGVLSIAAAKLGYGPIHAVDHESESVRATAENARINGVELTVERLDVREDGLPEAPIVLANLLAPLLLAIAPRFSEAQESSTVICSGILASQADEVSDAFRRSGYAEVDRAASGDWVALNMYREDRLHP